MDYPTLVLRNKLLGALGSEAAPFEIRLHTGKPGELGTNNVAGEAKKKVFVFRAALNGIRKNALAIEWIEVVTAETYKYFGIWEGGTFLGWGEFAAPVTVAKGDTFKINAETVELELGE